MILDEIVSIEKHFFKLSKITVKTKTGENLVYCLDTSIIQNHKFVNCD